LLLWIVGPPQVLFAARREGGKSMKVVTKC